MCGVCEMPVDPWVKTVKDREGDTLPICGECYEDLRNIVVIVPGPIVVWARCGVCGEWNNPREFAQLRPGAAGRGDAAGGTCNLCAKEVRLGG